MELIDRLSHLDKQLFLRCMKLCQHNWLTNIAKLISKTGDGYLQVLLPLTVLTAEAKIGVQIFKFAVIAFIIERSGYWLLKNTLKRKRPPSAIPSFSSVITASDEFSFPSGHTSGAFLLATLFYLFIPAVGISLFLWSILVGLSRLVLGVHFPADILAGAIFGSSIAYLVSGFT